MPPSDQPAQASGSRVSLILLILIALSYCTWVLSLPLFPTQDGPMHLYFTHVLHALLTSRQGFYSHFYYVRHILPPYSLYYYTLMLLTSFLPVLLADKVVICLYILSFAFGFRFLARTIGPAGDWIALPATILLLNWPLGMGFVNFCLSTSFTFWALGLWCRAIGRPDPLRKIGFLVITCAIMLTHPVPLLGVLGFCIVELTVRLIRFRIHPRIPSGFLPAGWLRDAAYVLLAMGTLVYVKLFTTSNLLKQVHLSSESRWQAEVSLLKGYVLLHSLTAFAGRSAPDTLYRLFFYALLAGSLFLAVRRFPQALRAGVWTFAQTWTLLSVLLLLAFPFIPPDLNNSAYFAARLVIYLWITALLAACGSPLNRRAQTAVAALSIVATTLTLALAYSRINPIAQDIAFAERSPLLKHNSVALLLHDTSYQFPSTVTYDPYFWSGVRMFRTTDSVLYDTPWLDLPIIPLGPQSSMPTYTISPNLLEFPTGLRRDLTSSPKDSRLIFSHVDALLLNSGWHTPHAEIATFLAADTIQGHRWTCSTQADYSLCTLKSSIGQGTAQEALIPR